MNFQLFGYGIDDSGEFMAKRIAYLSGSWYPKNKNECERQIKEFGENPVRLSDNRLKYRIGIAPHAGWAFSGRLANDVIFNISSHTNPDIVILAGGHLSANDRVYSMKSCEVETPLGSLSCVEDYHKELFAGIDCYYENGDSYEPDNTTELLLPFIKYYFDNVKIIICRIPPDNNAFLFSANLIELITEKKLNCALICSTDLTHYGFRFGFMPEGRGARALRWVKTANDKKIIDYACSLDSRKTLATSLKDHNSCCGGAITAGVETAKGIGCSYGRQVGYYTSADILNENDPSDFVGYCGIIF